MKNNFIAIVLFFLIMLGANAQQIPNGNFENWTMNTLYEEPDSFFSTNSWIYMSNGNGNVTKSTSAYHGSFAVQLTTVQTSTDTMFGGLFIGTPGNQTINGGIPYTGQPDSISLYVKYNIQPNDTAFFIVAFKNNGNIISMAVKTFTGIQSSYARISIPTNLPVSPAPDSLVAIISSSNLNSPRFAGSTITLDSITMIGTNQPFPNPSFENWTPVMIEDPDNWTTLNFGSDPSGPLSVTKSATAYNGAYALRIETVNTVWGQQMGLVTNGNFGQNGPTGGMPVNANPQKITGYYMYFPVGLDTALAGGTTYLNSVPLDSSVIKLTAQNTYTYFEIPFSYSGWPIADTLNIVFSSSNIFDTINNGLGSVLYIDDLNILYNPVGVFAEGNSQEYSVYPNPFSNTAIISLPRIEGNIVDCFVYDILGNVVMKKERISSNAIIIERNNLSAGMYQYRINLHNTSTVIAAGKLMVE